MTVLENDRQTKERDIVICTLKYIVLAKNLDTLLLKNTCILYLLIFPYSHIAKF